MNNNKFLNIRMVGEKNIGVIDIGKVYSDTKKKIDLTLEHDLKLKIEGKVVQALKEHFDCPVKIILTQLAKMNPIYITVEVIIEGLDEDHQETIHLEETWVY